MARKTMKKNYYKLELEYIDEWDVKTFVVDNLTESMLISDAGYLVISETALNALKEAGIQIPEEEQLKVVKPSEE